MTIKLAEMDKPYDHWEDKGKISNQSSELLGLQGYSTRLARGELTRLYITSCLVPVVSGTPTWKCVVH
jgi:hypothetical protein